MNGGKTTVENGANIEEVAHQYIHSLPREQEEIINDMFREFKVAYGIVSNGQITDVGLVELPIVKEEDSIIIQAYDCTKEQFEEIKEKNKKKNEKYRRQKNPSRARRKEELRRLIEEEDYDR